MRSFEVLKFRRRQIIQFAALIALLCWVSACATPIGVVRGTTQEIYYALTANVLSSGEPSSWSKQVLQRNNLVERFDADATATLAALHKTVAQSSSGDHREDRLFALSELSFYHAEQAGNKEDYLAAAVYAYAFLLPEGNIPSPDPLDPRLRLAADLYNLGLIRGLVSPDGEEVVLRAGKYPLPFGELEIAVDTSSLLWGSFRFKRFIPVGDFIVRGLSNRYRQPGIGAPLAAELEPIGSGPAAEEARKRIPPRLKVPVTALLQIDTPRRGAAAGKLKGRLTIYAADRTSTVEIDGRDVPLELEPTAALAYMLEGAPVWDFEFAGFRMAEPQQILGDGLIMMHPYRPGRIPVVLVHGTASSPARWAEMNNELTHDPLLEGRYQFWLFQYSTGQPVLYSAMLLRKALHNIIKEFDPQGRDSALTRMVVIGHSQGGLLTKLMAVKSGNRFWQNVTKEPFDQVEMPAETRELLGDTMFFEAVATVERVVFIATPHRGSYQATGWVLNLLNRLISLPGMLVSRDQDLVAQPAFAELQMSRLPISVET